MRNDTMLLVVGMGLVAGFFPGACTNRAESKTTPAPAAAAATPAADSEFEKKWAALAQAGTDVAYIEDDRAEGLMGNVRRASRVKADPPAVQPQPSAAQAVVALPEQPSGEEVQRIIRGNIMAVRGCYMNMARTGQARSGKAIVSFAIGADGRPSSVRVDAPSFRDTPLPSCVTAQIGRLAFPKSQKGGGAVSYPFVFVGG
jgi:outer membrane biosynthesis protein TonB